ncbi:MAG: serine/threonine protein phosphatase [Oscillospiraceae bacterium]|nr:serine/threonine protein phosphatase [Candidatus Ruminococcus equi]
MKLISSKKKTSDEKTCVVSPSTFMGHPFYEINRYNPCSNPQISLYSSLREAVPVIDAAISKIVRLLGTFSVTCEKKKVENAVNSFLKNVKVNGTSIGIGQFISTYFDQLLTYGTAVGEIVLSSDNSSVDSLYNASLKDIEIGYETSILEPIVYVKTDGIKAEKVQYQQLILLSLLNPTPGTLVGNSILCGLPFVSGILLKIFNTMGLNFERVGNVRFAVTYKPSDNSPSSNSRKKAEEIAKEWSKAMRDTSQVCDFVSVGDVSIKAIGADNQVLDYDVPIKHILEQIVSKLSIPPFLLGLSWSTTERMSAQQADILTSEIDYYRTLINPVIKKIVKTFLRLTGETSDFDIVWNNINLQDETELANARLTNAQAEKIETELSGVKN